MNPKELRFCKQSHVCFCRPRCIGFARRRIGRGGRILLDRASSNYDDVWSKLDYTIFETQTKDSDSRLPGIIDSKLLENSAARVLSVDDSSDKVLHQNPPIQNNHHNNNNVIKSENSKNQETNDDQTEKLTHSEKLKSLNNQKLDDFEQLLDSASASSNIINKKLVCKNNSDINDESFMLKSSGSSSLSQNELSNKNMSVGLLNSFNCEASSSGVSSTNGSLSFNLSNNLTQTITGESGVHGLTKQARADDDDEFDFESMACNNQEDYYANLMDEIKNEWLHFRPKTPPMRSSPTDLLFDSDLTDKSKRFAIELQMLDDGYKETEMNSYIDNVYTSQPMSFNFASKHILLNDDSLQQNIVNVKTEPADKDYEFIEDANVNGNELMAKSTAEHDAVKILLEKYQNDLAEDDSLRIDVDEIDFDECLSNNEPLGCSSFKLLSDDFTKKYFSENEKSTLNSNSNNGSCTIKSENSVFQSEPSINSVQNIAIVKEAPIAELQSHNYVLQYGSPVNSNTVTLNSVPSNTNMLSCNPNVDSGMTPATTLFQQQFINSGNNIIPAQQQQNKLQPIVYDSNTIVLAATPARKHLNGPTERNCNDLRNV